MSQTTAEINPSVFRTLGYKDGKTILRVIWKPGKSGTKKTAIGVYNGFLQNGLLINTGENSTHIITVESIEQVAVIELVQLLDLANNFIQFTKENELLF